MRPIVSRIAARSLGGLAAAGWESARTVRAMALFRINTGILPDAPGTFLRSALAAALARRLCDRHRRLGAERCQRDPERGPHNTRAQGRAAGTCRRWPAFVRRRLEKAAPHSPRAM